MLFFTTLVACVKKPCTGKQLNVVLMRQFYWLWFQWNMTTVLTMNFVHKIERNSHHWTCSNVMNILVMFHASSVEIDKMRKVWKFQVEPMNYWCIIALWDTVALSYIFLCNLLAVEWIFIIKNSFLNYILRTGNNSLAVYKQA